jgi:chromosomal replication initiator protein
MDPTKESWDYSVFWKEALNQIKQQIGEQEFVMWFNLEYDSSTENTIHVAIPSAFYKDQVTHRYLNLLESTLHELSGRELNVEFIIRKKKSEKPAVELKERGEDRSEARAKDNGNSEKRAPTQHLRLRSDFTFEKYVIGENNSFAANAAMAISKNPGKSYNPFLVYGGVGLGKTHLMQAIGNSLWMENEKTKIICVTGEEFVNEFIQSLNVNDKMNSPASFKNKYRHADVLLIDDIHFLQDKKACQEELFHTFNALYDKNKQMIFTCDRPVSELKSLSDRLRSRFERGLNVDLQPPNYETRVAILKLKVENLGLDIPQDVLEVVAKNISTNIRDLESALNRLRAYAELVGKNITVEIAQHQLKDVFGQYRQGNISTENIQKVVAEYFNLSFNDMKSKKKTQAIAYPRQLAMYITREITELSTTEIGMEFGGRDHTTVMHGCQKIEERKKIDPTLDSIIQKLIRTIKEYSTKV